MKCDYCHADSDDLVDFYGKMACAKCIYDANMARKELAIKERQSNQSGQTRPGATSVSQRTLPSADDQRVGSGQLLGQRAGARLVYKVAAFYPTVKGCGATDLGWDASRCLDFEQFLNGWAVQGWELHSQEYRSMTASSGCGSTTGSVLICIFKRYQ